ncbi:MAG: hypothetical protein OIN86_09895 [Candidatus Methanoperedens sp.]|nr:hypothetical protein [Candidatus Methanoperedens sp.]
MIFFVILFFLYVSLWSLAATGQSVCARPWVGGFRSDPVTPGQAELGWGRIGTHAHGRSFHLAAILRSHLSESSGGDTPAPGM